MWQEAGAGEVATPDRGGQRATKAWATRPGPRDPAKRKHSWPAAARRPEQEGSAAGGVRATPRGRRSRRTQRAGRGPARSRLAQGPCRQSGTSYRRASEMTLLATSRIKPSPVRAHAALADPPLLDPSAGHGSQRSFQLRLLSYPKLPPGQLSQAPPTSANTTVAACSEDCAGRCGAAVCGQLRSIKALFQPPDPSSQASPFCRRHCEKYNLLLFQDDQLGLKKHGRPTQGTAFSGSSLTVAFK